MSNALAVQAMTSVVGAGAFVSGLVGIARRFRLHRLLTLKQQGVEAKRVKTDPEVSAAMRRLRLPLAWATVLATCSVASRPMARRILA